MTDDQLLENEEPTRSRVTSILEYVKQFVAYARKRPQEIFQVTAVGCGLAGLTHDQMAPLFINAPENCWFDTLWQPIFGDHVNYWGTWENGDYKYTPEFEPYVDKAIFVFGSNEAGVHGAGAAAYAMRFRGAVYGEGVGRKGRSYAIPTKDMEIKTLPLGV